MNPDEALAAAVANRTEAVSRRSRIEAAQSRLEETGRTLEDRRSRSGAEETDVERLEKLSWTSVVSRLTGRHADDVERETAERDAARYALREAEARHQQAEAELAAARARLDELGDTGAAYVAALAEKESWVRVHAPAQAARLTEIAERRGVLEAEDREAREADDAGVAAHQQLAEALQQLSSAGAWSTWDTFGGGGLVTDLVKRSKMDAAVDELRDAERSLRKFAAELADLDIAAVRTLDLGAALEVFDIWFDNIFSDWAVRSRIKDADDRVREIAAQVKQVVDGLRARRREIAVELNGLALERERLLSA
ncbi:MAG: hypothetical protein ACJ72D_18485 [Marmoricola sp.]